MPVCWRACDRFAKAQDVYAYQMDVALLAQLVDRYKPAVMSALDGDDLVVRRFDRSRFAAEIRTFLEIYNRALDGTWDFSGARAMRPLKLH